MGEVTMVASVAHDGADYVAGETIDLPDDVADGFIVKGYATGQLSRPHTDEEVAELSRTSQVVGV